jgi:hypothetical protein
LPTPGDIIEIKDEKAVYFLGVCGIPKSPKYKTPYDVREYSITCNNANAILANRLVNVAYQDRTITSIVKDLYDKYIVAEGFTLGKVSDIPVKFSVYTAADYNLRYVLDELAEYVQGSWGITSDRQFYFIAKDDFEPFPHEINEEFCPISEIQTTIKDTDLRTQQIVSSSKGVTQTQYESFVYDGEENTFTVSFPVTQKPAVYINGVQVPDELVGVADLSTSDLMFTFTYNSNDIKFNEMYSGTVKLKAGDTVLISYVGYFSLRVVTRNQAQITEINKRTGTSGIIDSIETDNSISGLNDALAKGNALLENYGYVRSEAKMWTSVREMENWGINFNDLEILRKWTFNLPHFGLVGDYVLTERTLSPLVKGGDYKDLKVTLKFVDRAYIQSYGQILQTMQKQIASLSVRESDVIVENDDHEESVATAETNSIKEYGDFTPLYCTTNDGGFGLLCPFDIIPYAFSTNDFGEEYQHKDTATLTESLSTNNKQLDTDFDETFKTYEQIQQTVGETETDKEETTALAETITQSADAVDTDKEETLQCGETQTADTYQDFVPAYCCNDADGVVTSPVGLGLYCYSVNDFGVAESATETVATAEKTTTSTGEVDTDRAETVKMTETAEVEENTNFMVLFCTTAANFETDGQIASPLGLYLYAYSVNGG